jgi:DNA-binding MarR family transcriptional regulator
MLSPPTHTSPPAPASAPAPAPARPPAPAPARAPGPAPAPAPAPAPPQNRELARALGIAVLRFGRSLRHRSGVGLSPSLISALLTVRRHGPLTPSDLADHERVKRPTATRFIACLEHAGLVDRTADPEDGRSYRVAVTPRGRELLISARRQQDAYLAGRLETLEPDDLATLARAAEILDRLTAGEARIDQSQAAAEDRR